MKYFSLNHKASLANFETAVRNGLAPDKGLYFPEEIPILKSEFFDQIQHLSSSEIAFDVIKPFIGDEIPEKELKRIIKTTLSFDFPLVIDLTLFPLPPTNIAIEITLYLT